MVNTAICDRLYINQPFTAFSRITFLYRPLAQFMNIVMVLKKITRVTLQKLRALKHNRSELLNFEKSVI